jgi:hypothetical protein
MADKLTQNGISTTLGLGQFRRDPPAGTEPMRILGAKSNTPATGVL